ncbi:MAG: signal recognition particle-docking protein FtsY [Halobacteriovoraceae bacterium]|nr:signal recognition particle-docking protein FtsY [Halobacteriovoraceae bacterium]
MSSIISAIQPLFDSLNLGQANSGDVMGLILCFSMLLVGIFMLPKSAEVTKPNELAATEDGKIVEALQESKMEEVELEEITVVPQVSWKERLSKGLSRSRQEVWGKLEKIFTGDSLDEDTFEEVEELLYTADIGPTTAGEIIDALKERAKSPDFDAAKFKIFLKEFLGEIFQGPQASLDSGLFEFKADETFKRPKVIMVVGVNGAGKTTTIGKLATKLTSQGAKVVVGACDTFRAAAVDQLAVWCERAGAEMIRAKEGSNPSGVGYQALETAINSGADYCILDTAGRLHTKGNLMEELAKSKRVLQKLEPQAPDHVLLVIDAITGQNALRQAEEFHETLGLTGLIFTKCDGSSKAGAAVGIVKKLNVPITYIGVGENVEDLNRFNADEYLDSLLSI